MILIDIKTILTLKLSCYNGKLYFSICQHLQKQSSIRLMKSVLNKIISNHELRPIVIDLKSVILFLNCHMKDVLHINIEIHDKIAPNNATVR